MIKRPPFVLTSCALALALGMVASQGASAQQCTPVTTLEPGAILCLSGSFTMSVSASGSSQHLVMFTITDQMGATVQTLVPNTGNTNGILRSWDRTSSPTLFPGTFQICAMRGSGQGGPATVQLCLSGS